MTPTASELFRASRDTRAIVPARMAGASSADPRGATVGAAGAAGSRGGGLAVAMVATGLAYDAEVRAAQAQVLARLVPARARHPPLRQRRP